jgi:hypothetical protein
MEPWSRLEYQGPYASHHQSDPNAPAALATIRLEAPALVPGINRGGTKQERQATSPNICNGPMNPG